MKRVVSWLVLAAALGTAAGAAAQEGDTLRVEADIHPAVVQVGEPVQVRVAVALPDTSARLVGPPAPLTLGDVDILRSESAPAGPDSAGWRFTAALFRPGDQDLTTVPFTLTTSKGTRPVRLLPYTLTVESVLPDSADTAAIRDIVGPVDIPLRWRWGRVLTVLAGLAAVAVGAWWWRRRRKPAAERILPYEPSVPPEQAALRALGDLEREALPARGLVKEHYARLSLILRAYLERRFSVPAVESTTEEIRRRWRPEPSLPRDDVDEALTLFEEADLVKFARFDPGPQAAGEALARARRWVERRIPPRLEPTGTEGGE